MVDHWEGFEREGLLQGILAMVRQTYPDFRFELLSSIVSILAPEILKGAFTRRPCRRTLKYVGNGSGGHPPGFAGTDHFIIGDRYQSVSFNGGTYQISGYDIPLGCNFFEIVPEEKTQETPNP